MIQSVKAEDEVYKLRRYTVHIVQKHFPYRHVEQHVKNGIWIRSKIDINKIIERMNIFNYIRCSLPHQK